MTAAAAPLAPQNLEAEEHVLGAMLLSRNALLACAEILEPRDFYRDTHRVLFKAIVDLDLTDTPVDALTITDYLAEREQVDQAGGLDHIRDIAATTPAVGNAKHYAAIVRDMAVLRGLVNVGHECARMGYERPGPTPQLIERAEQIVFELAHTREQAELRHVKQSLPHTHELMVAAQKQIVTGTPTGIAQLDGQTAGLQPGNLIVLAARPSIGKSALAITAVHHIATVAKKPVAVFSLEMSDVEINQRLVAIDTGLELAKIRQSSRLADDEWRTVANGFSRLSNAPIYVDDSGDLRVMELRSRARRLKARQPDLALVVVDYLQLMIGEQRPENRVQEVSQISRGLKVLARELNVPVLALSQLNRGVEQRPDKRPMLSDLRESGAIEQDADLVVFIYRPGVYKKEPTDDEKTLTELILAKHRNGPTGTVTARWKRAQATFKDDEERMAFS